MRKSKENVQPARSKARCHAPDLKQELAQLRQQNNALREDVQLSFENYQVLQRLTHKLPEDTYEDQIKQLEGQLAELQQNLREIATEKDEIRQGQAAIKTDPYQELYEGLFKKSQKVIRYFEEQLQQKEAELQDLKIEGSTQSLKEALPGVVERLDGVLLKTRAFSGSAADNIVFQHLTKSLSAVKEMLYGTYSEG